MNEGHFKKARPLIEKRWQANQKDAQAAFLLARVKLATDQHEAALRLAEQAIALDPNVPEYHALLARIYGWMTEDAPLLKQYGYVKGLKKEVEAALSISPQQLDAMLIRAAFLNAAPSMVGGDKKQSEAIIQQMIGLNPERGYLGRARVVLKVKDYGRAEGAFRKALEINPKCYTAVVGLADIYGGPWVAAKAADAEKYGRQAIQLDPSRAAGYAALARLYAAQQRWADLDAVLSQAESAVPEDLSPYYVAAERLQSDGREHSRSEKLLKKYMSQEPEGETYSLAEAHYLYALVEAGQGRKDVATTELQAALRLRPEWDLARKELKKIR